MPPGFGDTLSYYISANSTNVKGNFTTVALVSDDSPISWINTATGYTVKIPLDQPPKNLTNPLVKIELPALNFAQINVMVNETNQNLTQNITIIGYNLTLDLNTIPEIGSVWEPADPHRNLTINLTFYLDSPMLDICDDGYIDWQYEGNFGNNSIMIDQENYNLAEVLNDYISDFGSGTETITLNFSATSAGKINITNLSIEYYTNPMLAYNLVLNNTRGIVLNDTSNSNIFYNFVYGNKYGIYSNSCSRSQYSISTFSDGSKNKSVTVQGNSNESAKLMIPNGAVIKAASFDINGTSFVSLANLTQEYVYCGYIINNTTDQQLNTTINLTNMDGWNVDDAYVKVDNLLYNNVSVNVTDVNLTAEHNLFNKSFHNKTNYVFFFDFMTSDTMNPLQFNITTNCTNVTADFEVTVDFFNNTEVLYRQLGQHVLQSSFGGGFTRQVFIRFS